MTDETENRNPLEHLNNYQYTCTDKSIVYRLILGRYYDVLLKITPKNISPNALTLIGLSFSLLSAVLTIFLDPGLVRGSSATKPTQHTQILWIECLLKLLYNILPLLNAAFLFLYQTFDALDGKQARRLKMSTPLGQIFDHGCDGLTCFFMAISITSSLGIGTEYFFITCLNFVFVYFFCNLEEFFTHQFSLGYINGPNEGILAGVALHILSYTQPTLFSATGFVNRMLLSRTVVGFLEISYFCLWTMVFVLVTFITTSVRIYRNKKIPARAQMSSACTTVFSMLISAYFFTLNGDSKTNLRDYVIYFWIMFAFNAVNLEISYARLLRKDILELLNKYNTAYTLFVLLKSPFGLNGSGIFLFALAFTLVHYVRKVLFIKNEICDFLGIKMFQIKPTKQD